MKEFTLPNKDFTSEYTEVMATKPVFYRLSEELLTMIVQEEPLWSFDTLKTLRLVHPRFAYLDDLMHRLFSRIIFSASPFCLNSLENEAPLDGVARYVKQIEFASSIFGIDVSREQFLTCAREQARKIALPRAGKAIPDWRSGISEQDTHSAYETYMVLHGEVAHALRSGRAVSVLTGSLKKLGNVRSIHVGQLHPDYDPIINGNTIEGVVLLAQLDRSIHRSTIGDQLLKLTVEVLASSNIRLIDLNISCWASGLEPWDMMPGWDNLDLSETQELTFEMELHGNYFMDEDVEQEMRRSCVVRGCSGLIAKAARSIEQLHLGTLRFAWGTDLGELETPNLRTIDLLWTSIDARPFSQWLRRCHQLEELTMERTHVAGPKRQWRMVFGAIREMPNAVVLTLNEMSFGASFDGVWMCIDTSTQVQYEYNPISDHRIVGHRCEDIEIPLSAFLSGSADWSPELDMALQLDDEDEM